MRGPTWKGFVTAAFGATVVVLAMASVAYACTTYKGRMTVTINSGSDGHGHDSTAAVGSNSGMSYCSTLPSGWGSSSNPKGQAHLGTAGGNITVTVAAQDDVCKSLAITGTNRLSNGTDVYNVNFNPGKMFTSTTSHNAPYVRFNDCMNNEPGNVVLDSNFDVSGGAGSGSYNIGSQTANATGEDGGVCVARDGNGEGMQVPLTVV